MNDWTETEFHGAGKITPIHDRNAVIDSALLNPHYTDTRFRQEQSIFVASQKHLVEHYGHDTVSGAWYIYSDRLHGWYPQDQLDSADQAARDSGAHPYSARYKEVFLKTLLDQPNLELVHIVAGVNRSNGYSYLVYGYIIKEE
jgi:hypothetical protein